MGACNEDDLSKKVEAVEQSIDFMNTKFQSILTEFAALKKENQSLKLENNVLKSQIQVITSKVKEQELLIDDLEQYIRRDCVEIKGIPSFRNEDTSEIVQEVAELLDVDLDKDDISISHRLPSYDSQQSSSNNGLPPPPTIIVKFVRREAKESFYKARFKLKNKSTQDLNKYSSETKNPIYLSESLTQMRRKLFKSCLKIKKELKLNSVYTLNGRIYMRKDKDSRSEVILNEVDLAKFKAKHGQST